MAFKLWLIIYMQPLYFTNPASLHEIDELIFEYKSVIERRIQDIPVVEIRGYSNWFNTKDQSAISHNRLDGCW